MMHSNKLVLLLMINTHCYFSKGGQVLSLTHSMTQTSVLYSLYLEPTIKHKLLRTGRTRKPNSRLGLIWKWFIAVHFHLNFHCCIISLITTDQFNVHIPRRYFGHLRNCTSLHSSLLRYESVPKCVKSRASIDDIMETGLRLGWYQGRHWARNCFTSRISSSLIECIIPWAHNTITIYGSPSLFWLPCTTWTRDLEGFLWVSARWVDPTCREPQGHSRRGPD